MPVFFIEIILSISQVVSETSTGTTSSQRMHTTLTVRVEAIDFDPGACALHLKGRNIQENQLVKLGAYHTLDLEPNRKFTLEKQEWDSIDLERLDIALDPAQQADVAAVVLHEGLAHVCLLTPAMTLVRAKIDMQIPRKRKGFTSQHEKGIQRFLDAVSTAFLRHVNFQVRLIVFIYVLFRSKKRHVSKANSEQAIDTLLLADSLFRAQDIETRKRYVGLVESVKEQVSVNGFHYIIGFFVAYYHLIQNGTVLIFSSMHVSGEQLSLLTGCAAILRFPMPEIEEDALSDEDDAQKN
uniref:ERF1_1 domain-containing protein n=1 Tax=Heterorhabditis bacteriophora TaxID=37862 RepID=A0A1I7X7Z8_HETBA